MNGTTFPDYPGQNDGQSQAYGGQNSNDQGNNYNRNSYGQNNGGNNYGNNGGNGSNQGGYNRGGGGWGNKGSGNGGNWGKGGSNGSSWKDRPKRPEETDMSIYLPYAVTGNPDAPQDILDKVDRRVRLLDSKGYTTRTGGLDGIETVAEKAAVNKLELQLPFRDFNQKQSRFTYSNERVMFVAKMFQPGFDGLKKGAQSFCGKNVRLVLGTGAISPALFLIVWTEDGCESARDRNSRTGFAGHSIAIASSMGIPVFNLQRSDAEQRLDMYLNSIPAIEPL